MAGRAIDLFKPGNHGSTFGGNPLACVAALSVLEVIEREKLCDQVKQNSLFLMKELQRTLGDNPKVKAIRGKGFMIGIELDRPAKAIRLLGLKHGIVLNVTAETVIRLLPPLIISEEELGELMKRLCLCIQEFE
jgi:acetylornithine/N-succinyldiaminopimelate aminotransferase